MGTEQEPREKVPGEVTKPLVIGAETTRSGDTAPRRHLPVQKRHPRYHAKVVLPTVAGLVLVIPNNDFALVAPISGPQARTAAIDEGGCLLQTSLRLGVGVGGWSSQAASL